MSQRSTRKESPGVGSSETAGSPGLRRSARETLGKKSETPVKSSVAQNMPVVRKSERLKKNSPEASSSSQLKTERVESQSSPSPLRRSERGKNQSSSNSNEKSEKSAGMSDAKFRKGGVEARNSEDVGTKRRRLDSKCFKALFVQQKYKYASPEPNEKPKLLGKAAQSNCLAVERDSEDEHPRENKLRKVVHDSMDVTSVVENQEVVTSDKGSGCAKHLSQNSYPSNRTVMAEDVHIPSDLHNVALESGNMLEEGKKLHDTQKNLHLMLTPELQKLCELQNLSEDVKKMAMQFLEYVMENHHVTREPLTLLQAFQLSVCWIAASLRKKKINGRKSLALAKKHLDFYCSEEDTDYVYLKMGLLKELFIQSTVNDKAHGHAYNTVLPAGDASEDSLVGLNPVTFESKSPRVFNAERLLVKVIRHIKKKCRERMTILIQNQREEIEELRRYNDEEKARLEQLYKVEVAVVRTIHAYNPSMAADKLKALEDQYSKRLEEHRNNLNIRFKSLEDKHSSDRDKENELTSSWKEDIVKEQVELLRKLPHSDSEDSIRNFNSNDQLDVLDVHKDCSLLENQEILKKHTGVLAGRVENCQLVIPDKPSALPPAASEAANNSIVMEFMVSTSPKVLLENSASVNAESGQVTCSQLQAASCADLTLDTEVPESFSVDVLPLHLINSALTDRPSAGKTLDFPIPSQQLSLNPLTIDVPQSHSSDKEVGVRHDSEAPSTDLIVPLHQSLAAPDYKVDNSSLVPLLHPHNGLPPSLLNVEVQSDSDIQLDQPSVHNATDHSTDEVSAAEAVHQFPSTEWQPELPSSTMTPRSEQSDSDMQLDQPLVHTAIDRSNDEPSAAETVHQYPATEGQPELPSSTITPGSEQSDSGMQLLDQTLVHTATDHSKDETSAAETVHQFPSTERQPELPSSTMTPRSEQSDSDMQLDQPLVHTATDHSNDEPSAAETVHQFPATEGQPELPSSPITPGSEQSDSGMQQLDQPLVHAATDHSKDETSAAEEMHQLPLVDSSSSQRNSSLPLLKEQPSGGGTCSTPNADAPNLSPSPSVSVSCISPTNIPISQSTSIPGPRATHDMSDFATSLFPGITNASTVSSRIPMFSYLDPLQSELERIQKEADHSIKIYDEMKQQLNTESEKEIEEIVAQIRKKYEMKNVELDAAFRYKKDGLDAYHSKVYMNRMLAEVFRNKCMELKGSVPPGMPQDNLQHQLPRLPPESAPGLPIIPGTSSAVQTSGNLPTTHSLIPSRRPTVPSASSAAPIVRNLQATQNPFRHGGPSAATSQNSSRQFPPARTCGNLQASHNPLRPSSPGAQATMSRLVQVVNRPSALFSSNSARPAVSSTSTTPPTLNLHSVSGIRAPPPHLRSRVSQLIAPTAPFAASPPASSHPHYSNVALSAPSATAHHYTPYHRPPASQSANSPTLNGSIQKIPFAASSASAAVVCLSDDE